ncbi:AAA family ATPase [Thermaurantiacus sp.]
MLRLVLSGVESTGKSTLAAHLEQMFGGLCVPEVGRAYTEALDRPLTLADHHAIARLHRAAADAAAAQSPPLLVEDTDIVMTTAWATMLFGGRDPVLAALPSAGDLHILLEPDVPFVPDRVRIFGEPEARLAFHRAIAGEFAARGIAPVAIGGDRAARQTAVVDLVRRHLARCPPGS